MKEVVVVVVVVVGEGGTHSMSLVVAGRQHSLRHSPVLFLCHSLWFLTAFVSRFFVSPSCPELRN